MLGLCEKAVNWTLVQYGVWGNLVKTAGIEYNASGIHVIRDRNTGPKEGKMIHRITKYKIREGQAAAVHQAVLDFIRTTRENSLEEVKIDVFVEKDGLTFYHIACFRDEQTAENHTSSEHLADLWEIVYERAESFSQSIEVDLIASTLPECQ